MMDVSINVTTNPSNTSSIEQVMVCNPLDVSLPVKIFEMFVYSIILLTSLIGNTLMIVIVYKRPALRNTINYFIVNMAVSDLMFTITTITVRFVELATGSHGRWIFDGTEGIIFCKLNVFIERATIAVSVQSLIWIALDRFVAVVVPFKANLIRSRFRAFAIASTWIVSMIVKSFDLYELHLVETAVGVICTQDLDTTKFSYRDYARVYTALFHVAPVFLLTTLYCAIAATLRRRKKVIRCKDVQQKNGRKQSAIKMSLCVIVMFNICTLPLIFLYILLEYEISIPCSLYKVTWNVAQILFSLSSTTNPIICLKFVRSYRCGLNEICKGFCNKLLPLRNWEIEDNSEGITLQEIRITPWAGESLAFKEA